VLKDSTQTPKSVEGNKKYAEKQKKQKRKKNKRCIQKKEI
jgi:hypothetical protein